RRNEQHSAGCNGASRTHGTALCRHTVAGLEIASRVKGPDERAVGGVQCSHHAVPAAGENDAGDRGQGPFMAGMGFHAFGGHAFGKPNRFAIPQPDCSDSARTESKVTLVVIGSAAPDNLASELLCIGNKRRTPERYSGIRIVRPPDRKNT